MSKIIYAQWLKITDHEIELVGHITTTEIKYTKENGLRTGKLYKPFAIETGSAGEDFIRELKTVIIKYHVYKIPRFANPIRK